MEEKLEFVLIKWFDKDKGFGVIQASFNQEYFLHISNMLQPSVEIHPLDVFIFRPKKNAKNNRLEAHDVRSLNSEEDFDVLIKFFPQADSHIFDIPVKDVNGFLKKAKREISLRKIALVELAHKIGFEKFALRVQDYLNKELDRNYLLAFMELFTHILHEPRLTKNSESIEQVHLKFMELLDNHQKFEIWKRKKIFLLGLSDEDEYCLSGEELAEYFDQLDDDDLKRIANQTNGKETLPQLLHLKFGPIKTLDWEQAVHYKKILGYLPERNPDLLDELEERLFDLESKELLLILDGLPPIHSWNDFSAYSELMDVSGLELSVGYRETLFQLIEQEIRKKASPEMIGLIWVHGKLSKVSDDEVFDFFIRNINDTAIRSKVLNRLSENQVVPLFTRLLSSALDTFAFQYYLEIIQDFIKRQNQYKTLPELLSKEAVNFNWETVKHGESIHLLRSFIHEHTETRFKIELFKQGHHFSELKFEDFWQYESLMEFKDWEQLLNEGQLDNHQVNQLLLAQVNSKSLVSQMRWALEMARLHLDENQFNELDQLACEAISDEVYFELWCDGVGRIIPRSYFLEYCKADVSRRPVFSTLVTKNAFFTKGELLDLYLKSLPSGFSLETKAQFDKFFDEFEFFTESIKESKNAFQGLRNKFFELLAWYFDSSIQVMFDFDYLSQKFIYFEPSAQTKIVKRLFYFKEIGSFDLTLDHLNSLTRVDGDLYRMIQDENPSHAVDISTDIIIKFLYHLGKESKILMERDILSIVYAKVGKQKVSRFQLGQYFPKCHGRTILKHSFENTNGRVFKVPYKDIFYIGITFPYSSSSIRYIEEIKQFPKRNWYHELKHWGVSAKSIEEVKDFAARNRFFIYFTGDKFKDNPHLANEMRSDIPSSVKFCEGRKSREVHKHYKRDFWWCRNDACFKNNEPIISKESWFDYTILDFIRILGIDQGFDSLKSKERYYQFAATLNRMEQLLDVLYCRMCDELLHPMDSSNYAAYRVTRFACANPKCKEHNQEIYLTHCLNGRCNMLIDSRDSKKCDNGMYICRHCTCCCSNEVYKRRMDNLITVGKSVPSDLRYKIENDLGHLEKREHYCYRCGNQLVHEGGEIYECKVCLHEVDLSKYKFNKKSGFQQDSGDENEDLPF
jgi:hypothetical protein